MYYKEDRPAPVPLGWCFQALHKNKACRISGAELHAASGDSRPLSFPALHTEKRKRERGDVRQGSVFLEKGQCSIESVFQQESGAPAII